MSRPRGTMFGLDAALFEGLISVVVATLIFFASGIAAAVRSDLAVVELCLAMLIAERGMRMVVSGAMRMGVDENEQAVSPPKAP